jgi:putative Mn2+ efflux pump MntP
MKYVYFIKWLGKKIVTNVKSWDRWMYGWLITCAWGPTAFAEKENYPNSFNYFITFVLVFWVGYGLIYTSIKNAYRKFQEEQDRIVSHLKDVG